MSRINYRQRIILSAYLVTAVTFVGLCGELLVPGHHVHVGDPAGHHHHLFTGSHHHQGDGASPDVLGGLDGAAGQGSCGVEEPTHSSHPSHQAAHRTPYAHEQGHGHSHPYVHETDDRQGTSEDDPPADPRGPSMGREPQTSAACASEASVEVVSARQATSAPEPSRVPDPSESPGPNPDSPPDPALSDGGLCLDDPTPRRESWVPLPRLTSFPAIARLEVSDDPTRRPDSARGPPPLSLV